MSVTSLPLLGAAPAGAGIVGPVAGGSPAETGAATRIVSILHQNTPLYLPTQAQGGLLGNAPFLVPGPGRCTLTGLVPGTVGGTGPQILWSWDGGSTYALVNGGTAVGLNTIVTVQVPVDNGDQINVAASSAVEWAYLDLTYEPRTVAAPAGAATGGGAAAPFVGSVTTVNGTTSATANTSSEILAANTATHYLLIQNTATSGVLWVAFGEAAVVGGAAVALGPGAALIFDGSFVPNTSVAVAAGVASLPWTLVYA